jgi:hypothetical protein
MAESLTVDQVVVGSTPIRHPFFTLILRVFFYVYNRSLGEVPLPAGGAVGRNHKKLDQLLAAKSIYLFARMLHTTDQYFSQ